jgi:hypothetical protein
MRKLFEAQRFCGRSRALKGGAPPQQSVDFAAQRPLQQASPILVKTPAQS